MPEPPAEHSERPWLVAEEARDLGGGDSLGKKGAQRLVLPLSGVGRFPKEAFLICKRIWCFFNVVILHYLVATVKRDPASSAL
jgi:hypothetical protein